MEQHQRIWLRLEGMIVAVAAIWLFAHTGTEWLLFAAFFLLPDLLMLGYLHNARIGAYVYNFGHSYVTVGIVFAVGTVIGWSQISPIALIWVAHIGIDRMVGYGLKSTTGFKTNHLN